MQKTNMHKMGKLISIIYITSLILSITQDIYTLYLFIFKNYANMLL